MAITKNYTKNLTVSGCESIIGNVENRGNRNGIAKERLISRQDKR